MRKWLTSLRTDFLTREFVPLKLLFFFMMGGMNTLFPFLTIQARSLGVTGQELGLIYSLLPLVGIFAPSLAGLIADKIGNFKIFLSLTIFCSGLAALLFIFIPPGRIQHTLPEHLPLIITCTIDGNEVRVVQPFTCDVINSSKIPLLNIEHCRYDCSNNAEQKHIMNNFMEKWCDRTEKCKSWKEAGIKSGSNSQRNEPIVSYEVEGQIQSDQNTNFLINNLSIPIKVNPTEAEAKFGINQLFCPNFKQFIETNKQFYPEILQDKSGRKECWLECKAFTETQAICSNDISTEILKPALTIILYIVIRLTNGLTLATSFTLFEGAVIAILKEHNGDLGFQRMYGNLGMIILTPISGKLIDYFSKLNNKEDYTPAFFFYCAIKILCSFFILFINLEFKHPSNTVLKDFRELIVQPRVAAFILFTVVIGTCYGFIETFLFWLLEDLGADKSLMGITVTVGAVFGIPLLMTSSFFINKLGHVNTLSLCVVFYVLRLVGYSLIRNPWLAMLFESMESFTNSLMTVTSISYAGVLSKPSTVASLQGLYGGTYHGVGRGVGSLVGGIMIKRIGNSGTFQILAAACAIAGFIYFLVNKFIFQKNDSNMEENKRKKITENDKAISTENGALDNSINQAIDKPNNVVDGKIENKNLKVINEPQMDEANNYGYDNVIYEKDP